MSVVIQSLVRAVHPGPSSSTNRRIRFRHVVETPSRQKSMDDFASDVRARLQAPLHMDRLLAISAQLEDEFHSRSQSSDISMLPSYQHTLPTGNERGDVLALDVGGSTFRIALISLKGKQPQGGNGLQVRKMRSFVIDKPIRDLKGEAFFDWMADRIGEILAEYHPQSINGTSNPPLPMGMSWSFPIEQTSPRTGNLLAMGKGFCATHGVEGRDLSDLITFACQRKGVNVEMRAIINDGAATLLSQAYRDPTTRMSLILGTGTNAGVFFPVRTLASKKFGVRPDSWYAAAKHVLVNTEISTVGKNILPTTKWDDDLNAKHPIPDFQPLEYLTTGRYLGEIVRLILIEAISTAGLFNGHVPERLDEPYAFDTRIISAFESDTSSTLEKGRLALLESHPLRFSSPRLADLEFVRDVARLVSRRAAAYLATAIHALWTLRTRSEGLEPGVAAHVTVACDGTIIEKYPGFRTACQWYLDELCSLSGASRGAVTLAMAPESSIFGAAVAVSCMQDD